MRVIEVCLLGSRPGDEPLGGGAVAGRAGFLAVSIFGAWQPGVVEKGTVGSSNGTDALKLSVQWLREVNRHCSSGSQ